MMYDRHSSLVPLWSHFSIMHLRASRCGRRPAVLGCRYGRGSAHAGCLQCGRRLAGGEGGEGVEKAVGRSLRGDVKLVPASQPERYQSLPHKLPPHPNTQTHTLTYPLMHARPHACPHARTHARTQAYTHNSKDKGRTTVYIMGRLHRIVSPICVIQPSPGVSSIPPCLDHCPVDHLSGSFWMQFTAFPTCICTGGSKLLLVCLWPSLTMAGG